MSVRNRLGKGAGLVPNAGVVVKAMRALTLTLSLIGPGVVLGAEIGKCVADANSVVCMTADPVTGTSMAIWAISPQPPRFKVEISTNLINWADWKFVTNRMERFDLLSEGVANLRRCFFRPRPLQFDLTNWKLTLPVSADATGTPQEISQPDLLSFQDPNYFYTNAAGNAIVFRAPCGGVTTAGSQYPRTELRELINNGMDKASWSTTNGVHTMEIVQAVTHLPEVKPQLVCGQIHNAEGDLLTFRLQSQDLMIDKEGVKTPITVLPYKLGTLFSVKFVAHDGVVDCYYNGNRVSTQPVLADGCYFKAGCYTQSNTNAGDLPTAYGEVIIYGLSVTHR